MFLSRVYLYLGIALFCQYSFAADQNNPPMLTESEFFGDIPIVYTASRLPQPKSEAPAAVTVIDADMIKALGIRRIEDVFRFVPGFQVGFYRGFFGVVTYHGGNDEFVKNMQVFVDGRSVYGPLFGGVRWQDLPLVIEDIERIEVIRGPNATTYGSNAVSAVINIITRHSSQNPGKHAKVTIGSDNIKDVMYSQSWVKENSSYRLSARHRQDDGFAAIPDDERTDMLTFKSDQQLDNDDAMTFQFGVLSGTRGYGYYNDPIFVPRTADGFSHFQQISWRHTFNNKEEFDLNFFHDYKKHVDDFYTTPLDLGSLGIVSVPASLSLTEERYDLEAHHTIQLSPSLRVNWGASTRLEKSTGKTWLGTGNAIDNWVNSIYANSEWRANQNNIINAGLMVEKTGEYGTHLMPRLAYNHHFNSRNTIRLSVSHATRKPIPVEEHGNQIYYVGNTPYDINILSRGGLVPEENTTYEIAFLNQNLSTGISWNIRLYRDNISNIINEITKPVTELAPEQEAFDYVNSGAAHIDGLEFEYAYRPSSSLRFIANQAFMHADYYDFNPAVYKYTYGAKAHEDSVPAYTTSLILMYQMSHHWFFTSSLYRVAKMQWLGDGSLTDPYTRVDLRLSRNFRLRDSNGSISLTIQNLGKGYADFNQYSFHVANIFDRRIFLSAELNF